MLEDRSAGGLIITMQSRVLKRSLGPTAWAVLEDVVLDAIRRNGRWLARTSIRRVADHLGLTPGTVARALARLCTEGIVHREDRRDPGTGRFRESVYVIAPLDALRPCIESPHTDRRDTETPDAVGRDTESPHTGAPGQEDRHAEQAPGRRPNSSGRRRAADPVQQLPLGDEPPATTPGHFNPSTPTPRKALHPKPQTPTTSNPELQTCFSSQPLKPITRRPTDICQVFDQALPELAWWGSGAAGC